MTEPENEFQALHREIAKSITAIQRTPSTVEALKAQLAGTVLPLLQEVIVLAERAHLGLAEEVDARLAVMEGEETQIVHEDAEKLMALVEGARLLAGELAKTATGEAKVRLDALLALADECQTIVDEGRLPPDEEEENGPTSGVAAS